MRFDAKHNPLKRHAHVVGNVRNIYKTLSHKHQVQQMYNFKLDDPFSEKICVTNAYPVTTDSLKKSDVLLDNLRSTYDDDFTLNSTVCRSQVCLSKLTELAVYCHFMWTTKENLCLVKTFIVTSSS